MLHDLVQSRGMQSSTFGTSSTAGAIGRMARLASEHIRGSTLLGSTTVDHVLAKVNERDVVLWALHTAPMELLPASTSLAHSFGCVSYKC